MPRKRRSAEGTSVLWEDFDLATGNLHEKLRDYISFPKNEPWSIAPTFWRDFLYEAVEELLGDVGVLVDRESEQKERVG